jgi:hypothetical protein
MTKTKKASTDVTPAPAVLPRPREMRDILQGVKRSATLANRFLEASRQEAGSLVVTEASVAYVEQQLMQSLFEVVEPQKKGEPFDAPLWQAILKTVGEVVKIRAGFESLARAAGEGRNGKPRTSDGPGLVARMREALGLPPAPPPRPLPMPPEPVADTEASEDDQPRFTLPPPQNESPFHPPPPPLP